MIKYANKAYMLFGLLQLLTQVPIAGKSAGCGLAQYDAITIVIHGVWFPVISSMIHKMDCPLGLTPAHVIGNEYTLGKIGKTLTSVSPQDFPDQSVYVFGWPGALGFAIRERAAHDLYELIKDYHGSITIIAHSHGCNVALNLAKIAQEQGDKYLSIDRLILLAGPVQAVTEPYVDEPLFKRVYSFYSQADIAQIIDPQGLYYDTYKAGGNKQSPFFSQRVFSSPKVMQAQILLDARYPSHNDFLYEPFIRKLPLLIEFMDQAVTTSCAHTQLIHALINVPTHDMPQLVKIYT